MSKKTILLFLFIFCCCFAAKASADALFTNNIEMSDGSIVFTVHEMYTTNDSLTFREGLDIDNSGDVNTSEIEVFREQYLSNGGAQFLEYVLVDDGSMQMKIDSIDIQFEGAEGPVDNSSLNVTTTILYNLDSVISEGEHSVWVLGHPLISNMRFTLPQGMELISYDGLDNSSQSVQNGRVELEGFSGIRSFTNDDKPAFEYAAYVKMQKEPFYKNNFFLPLLIIVELILASIALYIIKSNKNK